jgi:hypothetical protein
MLAFELLPLEAACIAKGGQMPTKFYVHLLEAVVAVAFLRDLMDYTTSGGDWGQ